MTPKDLFSGSAGLYAQYRPEYPGALLSHVGRACDHHAVAWDCATGNGQVANKLADSFDQVIATDISNAQLQQAVVRPNIDYRVASAEQSGLPSNSVDLVCVAQALHWFDEQAFYAEARRVLRPGGVLAVWSYQLPRVAPELDLLIDRFHWQILGEYWEPERRHVDAAYTTLQLPVPRIHAPLFPLQNNWNREQFCGYLSSWSAVQRYRDTRQQDPLDEIRQELASLWPRAEETRRVTAALNLFLGQPKRH